ncbi:MAG: hypothetical protein Q7V88_00865 [Actinomycetota bacterium]|nr:hypothetical protein [Actinomycetota bacterium]
MNRRPIAAGLLAATLLLGAACSSSRQVGAPAGTDGADGATSTSGDATTTSVAADASSTSSSAVSTSTSSTTTVPAVPPLELHGNGIGPHRLGDELAGVYDALVAGLGAPASDVSVDYPNADGIGQYTTAEGDTGFVAPHGRSVCWAIGFCAEFGGATAAAMQLTGWVYGGDATGSLRSTSGATIGTRWSNLPAMHVEPGGCYSVGGGDVDGIRLVLESSGVPFGTFNEAGDYVSNLPAAADVTILSMETGEVPVFLYGDC